MRSRLILAGVLIAVSAWIVVGQQIFQPVQPTGSLNHTVIDGLPADAAKGAARATAPVPSGCEATTTFIANNQMGVLRCDPANLALVVESVPPGPLKGGNSGNMTATTSTVVIAGTASNYTYITHCSLTNDHASTDTDINFQDGNGGTVIPGADHMMTPHGGGRELTFPTPLKVPTLGNGLFAVNVTTMSSTYVSCSGFTSTTSY